MHENDSLKCSYAGWIARRTNAVKSNVDRNKENVKVTLNHAINNLNETTFINTSP